MFKIGDIVRMEQVLTVIGKWNMPIQYGDLFHYQYYDYETDSIKVKSLQTLRELQKIFAGDMQNLLDASRFALASNSELAKWRVRNG